MGRLCRFWPFGISGFLPTLRLVYRASEIRGLGRSLAPGSAALPDCALVDLCFFGIDWKEDSEVSIDPCRDFCAGNSYFRVFSR